MADVAVAEMAMAPVLFKALRSRTDAFSCRSRLLWASDAPTATAKPTLAWPPTDTPTLKAAPMAMALISLVSLAATVRLPLRRDRRGVTAETATGSTSRLGLSSRLRRPSMVASVLETMRLVTSVPAPLRPTPAPLPPTWAAMAAATATVLDVMEDIWLAVTETAPLTATSESRTRARKVDGSSLVPMALRTIATPMATPTAAPCPPAVTATAAARAPVPARMVDASEALTLSVVAASAGSPLAPRGPAMVARTTSAWV